MSYISPAISNYNDDAPPDDGTETSDNEITWAIIKDELTDPLKNYAEAIDSASSTAFGDTAATVGQIEDNSHVYAVSSGTDTITLSLTPTLTAYSAGQTFRFKAGGTCTGGGVTLNVDSLGAKTVVTNSIASPRAGDISANGVYTVVYDGTRFLLQNPERETDGVFANNSNGNPNISDTKYEVQSLSAANWHEIGPTGETNAWSALDGVPSDADWIDVKIYAYSGLAAPGTSVSVAVYAREAGAGDDSINIDNRIAESSQTGASATLSTAITTSAKIPIATGKLFDVYYAETGNAVIELYLIGYGWN